MSKVMIFDMLNLNPKTDEKCQTLNAYNGTGGNNMPLILTFSKQKRAQSKDDYETWVEADASNTLNAFDLGDIRATTLVVSQDDDDKDTNREKILLLGGR